uniref:GAF domain-containing protein n=1 Tax=Hemiselmis andersenii TaxID=464988 RepID=A0A6U4WVQ3_HEMAN
MACRAGRAVPWLLLVIVMCGSTAAFVPPSTMGSNGCFRGGAGFGQGVGLSLRPHGKELAARQQLQRGAMQVRCEVKISGNDQFLVAAGSLSLALLMGNRLMTGELAAAQSRVDLLGVAVSSVMLLTVFARADVQAREKQSVKLAGVEQDEVDTALSEVSQQLLRFAAQTYLKVAASTKCVAVVHRGKTVLRQGIMGRAQQVELGPIVDKACSDKSQAYLADLQILPGRKEFTYLPVNTQAVIIEPFGESSALIIGADKVRAFTGLDLAMAPVMARLVQQTLEP